MRTSFIQFATKEREVGSPSFKSCRGMGAIAGVAGLARSADAGRVLFCGLKSLPARGFFAAPGRGRLQPRR